MYEENEKNYFLAFGGSNDVWTCSDTNERAGGKSKNS